MGGMSDSHVTIRYASGERDLQRSLRSKDASGGPVWVPNLVICASWTRWRSFEGHGYGYLGGTQRTISNDECGDHASITQHCGKNFASVSKNL